MILKAEKRRNNDGKKFYIVLDRDLIKFALTIPPHLLISDGYQKKVLRDSAKGILLDKVRLSKQKKLPTMSGDWSDWCHKKIVRVINFF